MPIYLKRLAHLSLIALLAFVATFAVQPAAAQFQFGDGTTLNDFVLDADGYAWFKQKPYGHSSLKPNPQLRFIADPGNARGGNALHPESHKQVEDVVRDVVRDTGSYASWEIAWSEGPGLAGGYQIRIRTDRGETSISAVQVGLTLMKVGREQTRRRLIAELASIL
jgi:hypothetical protein